MALDALPRFQEGYNAPAAHAVGVTPNDNTDLAFHTRGLWVGTGGTVIVIMSSESNDAVTVSFPGIPNGSLLPIRVRRVLSTGTTASGIVALA